MTSSPYADAAPAYLALGFSPLPIRSGDKRPAVSGFHGLTAPMASADDVARFSDVYGPLNVALRLPDGVVGLDVDTYGPKVGADQLVALESSHGALPPSPLSSAREGTTSGIRFFRVPLGLRTVGKLAADIDVIAHGIRYAVASPSVHPSGRVYTWKDPETGDTVGAPDVADLPDLPAAWVDLITSTRGEGAPDVAAWLDSFTDPDAAPGPEASRAIGDYRELVESGEAHRGDAREVTRLLARAAALGEQGMPSAYAAALALYASTGGDAADFDRMLSGALAYEDTQAAKASGLVFTPPAELVQETTPEAPRATKWDTFLIDSGELENLPKPEPLIADTLDRNTLAILGGPYASGKSFVALSWALSVATGASWAGRRAETGRVLYVLGEGLYGMRGRVAAWCEHHGREVPAGALHFSRAPVNLGDPADVAGLSELVTRGAYSLVVFDTLARMAVGMEENSAKDMGVLVDAADTIRRASPGSTVVMVAHTGKDLGNGIRGSSAIPSAADTMYQVSRNGDDLDLTRTKRKDGRPDDKVGFTMTESGPSVVIVPRDLDDKGADRDRGFAEEIKALLLRQETATQSEIVRLTRGRAADILGTLGDLVKADLLLVETGPRGAKLYSLPADVVAEHERHQGELVAVREGFRGV